MSRGENIAKIRQIDFILTLKIPINKNENVYCELYEKRIYN